MVRECGGEGYMIDGRGEESMMGRGESGGRIGGVGEGYRVFKDIGGMEE